MSMSPETVPRNNIIIIVVIILIAMMVVMMKMMAVVLSVATLVFVLYPMPVVRVAMVRAIPKPIIALFPYCVFVVVVVVVVVVMMLMVLMMPMMMPLRTVRVSSLLYPVAAVMLLPRALTVVPMFPPQHLESPCGDDGAQPCLEQMAGSAVMALCRPEKLVACQRAGG